MSAVAAAAVLGALPSAGLAGAFYAPEQSARAAGRAFSGEAADTGADMLWWNPAAIARSPRQAYVGAHGRWTSTDVEDEGSTITRPIPPAGLTTPVGGRARISDPTADHLTPNAAFSMPFGDRWAAGLSVTRPFHLETEYGADAWTRYDTVRNRIETTDIQGTIALQARPWLDLGFGVSAHYTDATLESAYPNLSPLLPDAMSRVSGDGWNYGFSVGAQARFERLALGASYRSAIQHDLEGTLTLSGLVAPLSGANIDTAVAASFSTPWIATIAARWDLTPRLTLNGQVQRFGWSEYDEIELAFAGQHAAIHQHYEDTTTAAVGLDYALSPQWTVRTGVQFDPTPTPDDLREPGVADSDRWLVSVGASAQLRPNVALDLALGHIAFKGDRIYEDAVFYPGTPAETTARLRGKMDGDATVLSAGLRWKF